MGQPALQWCSAVTALSLPAFCNGEQLWRKARLSSTCSAHRQVTRNGVLFDCYFKHLSISYDIDP